MIKALFLNTYGTECIIINYSPFDLDKLNLCVLLICLYCMEEKIHVAIL